MRSISVLLLLLACGPALARLPQRPATPPPVVDAQPSSPFAACDAAIAAAERAGLPGALLPAIARVESGRLDPSTGRVRPWPWTINVEGVGSFFDSKEQVIAAVQALQARGVRSIDVGCMQVNLMHHPRAFPSLDDAFDPAANARYAVTFLSSLFRQTGNWSLATAYYHSATPERGEDYQRRVFGRVVTPMGAAPRASAGSPAQAAFAAMPSATAAFAAMPPPTLLFGAFAPPPAAAPVRRR